MLDVVQTVDEGQYSDTKVEKLAGREFEVTFAVVKDPESGVWQICFLGFVPLRASDEEKTARRNKIGEITKRFVDEVLLPLLERSESASEGTASDEFGDSTASVRNTICRMSAYAYPAFMLADDREWSKMMERTEALLPLSLEEQLTLERLLAGECLPAVIEGRAGSGKTTLLTFFVPERVV